MNEQIKKIKILDAFEEGLVAEIQDSILQINGVVDVKVDVQNSMLTYVLDMWASDYDVMVSIMNLLSDNFKIESEPYFDEDEAVEVSEDIIYAPTAEEIEESEEAQDYEEVDEKQLKRKELKYKFIEVGLSIACIIVGLILGSIRKTQEAAPYLYVIAFSLASYEFIIDTVLAMVKKQFNFSNIALLIAVLSALIVGLPLSSAVTMLSYLIVYTLYNIYQIDVAEKQGLEFDFNVKANAKINKISGIVLAIVFVICLFVVFIVPIFLGDYATNLLDCAKRATSILLIFSISPAFVYVPLCYSLLFKQTEKNAVKISDENVYEKLGSVKKVAFLGQGVFVDETNNLKENALGSVLELYDAGISESVLLSSNTKESNAKLRKELSITQSVSNLSDSEKNDEIKALNGRVLAVGNLKTDASVSLCLKEDVGVFDVAVKDGNLKKIPFIVKLCKRCNAIIRQNAVLTLIVKIAMSVLCGLSIISDLTVGILPVIAISVLTILNALRNNLEAI
ncbi:MAG: hypothetical protein IKV61_01165 [Clostridia bacterium]|nr:hypothetical protein [Clostridia bacterium]